MPREVFFGRLGFAGAFFTVWASDFERFLPATSDSFPIAVLQAHPTEVTPPLPWVGCRLATVYAVSAHADMLENVGRNRPARALIGLRAGADRSGLGSMRRQVVGATAERMVRTWRSASALHEAWLSSARALTDAGCLPGRPRMRGSARSARPPRAAL